MLCHVTQPPAAGVCASPSVPGLVPELPNGDLESWSAVTLRRLGQSGWEKLSPDSSLP